MPFTLRCPEPQVLQRLLLGLLPGAEGEELAHHLEECSRCTALARTRPGDDRLVEAVRTPAVERPESQTVRALIEQLRELRPDFGALEPTAAGPPEMAPTPPAAPLPALLDSVHSTDESTEEHYDFLAPPEGPDEIGRLGPYRILKVLGAGGMGVVFHAVDPQLQRPVALKAMKPALAASSSARQRFLREARAVARFCHDHVVSIYQVGEERSIPFLVMPLLQGESLAARLWREGILPTAEALRIGREIAEGLAAAHEQGLIHRDIKPANIWLEALSGEPGASATGGCRVKILDFGLAQTVGGKPGLSWPGIAAGTPAYMSPEQAPGEAVDARSDLFSLGCVLHRMCTGQPPVWEPGAASAPRRDPEAPQSLSDLIVRLLAEAPADRPPSARVVVEALREIEGSLAAPASACPNEEQAPAPGPAAHAPARTHSPWLVRAAVLLLLIGGGLLAGSVLLRLRDRDGKMMDVPAPPSGAALVPRDVGPATASLDFTPLVLQPAPIPGVERWTIEPRGHLGQVNVVRFWTLAKKSSVEA